MRTQAAREGTWDELCPDALTSHSSVGYFTLSRFLLNPSSRGQSLLAEASSQASSLKQLAKNALILKQFLAFISCCLNCWGCKATLCTGLSSRDR